MEMVQEENRVELDEASQSVMLFFAGNIGAGKSTMLLCISKHFSKGTVVIFEEEVDGFLLKQSICDLSTAAQFQTIMLCAAHGRVQLALSRLLHDRKVKVVAAERDSFENIVFAVAKLKECKHLTDSSQQILDEAYIRKIYNPLNEFFDKIRNKHFSDCNAKQITVFLWCDLEEAKKRIAARDRIAERDMSHDYLRLLHVLYYFWVITNYNSRTIMVVDYNERLDPTKIQNGVGGLHQRCVRFGTLRESKKKINFTFDADLAVKEMNLLQDDISLISIESYKSKIDEFMRLASDETKDVTVVSRGELPFPYCLLKSPFLTSN